MVQSLRQPSNTTYNNKSKSSPRCEHQGQRWQCLCECIPELKLEVLGSNTRRERQVEAQRKASDHHAHLHHGDGLARARPLAPGEGDPGRLLGGEALPALGLEGERIGPVSLVALHGVGRHRSNDVAGDEDVINHEALRGSYTGQTTRDGGTQTESLVDDPVEVGNGTGLLIGPVAVAIGESRVKSGLEGLVDAGILGEVVQAAKALVSTLMPVVSY